MKKQHERRIPIAAGEEPAVLLIGEFFYQSILRDFTFALASAMLALQLNNAYEECARDKPCDRTTTCRGR